MKKILITGATGLIGRGLVRALLLGNEKIRILSRGALEDSDEFPADRIEPFPGDVGHPPSLAGAAGGCDLIVHIAGISEERPPRKTFDKINVEGTRAILEEAARAGVRKFIHISSLGAERGSSDYHRSKRKSEDLVREFDGDWLILRPGNVYGPGDTVLSELLTMIRTLPVVPLINNGDQEFQPVWYEDLANAIARAIRNDGPWHSTLELAGPDRTTMSDVIDRLCRLTDRDPLRVPVPDFLATLTTKLGKKAGVEIAVDENKITMLLEENVIRAPNSNSLIGVFGIEPVGLEHGLRMLVDALPEQTPEEGIGALEHKTFAIEIIGSGLTPSQVIDRFREHGPELMDVEFESEPGTDDRIELGATLTGELPLRGHFQVRVEESEPDRVTLATLKGHPLAGIVRFTAQQSGAGIRFAVDVYARPATELDRVTIRTFGRFQQDANWKHLCERMAELCGGAAPDGVSEEERYLEDEEAREVEEWVEAMIAARHRTGAEPSEREAAPPAR